MCSYNNKRLNVLDIKKLIEESDKSVCPSCGLFRRERRTCSNCRREGCENCVCEEGICMACDFFDGE